MKYFQKLEKNFAGSVPNAELNIAINEFQKRMIFGLLVLFVVNIFI